MELRHLRAFVAVAEARHFGRAAARLYLSPPALTHQVHQLEREVGVRLFERAPVALTEAGAALLPRAYEALDRADAALDALQPFRDGGAGRLRVGIMSHGAGTLGAAIIDAFLSARPGVEFTVHALDFTEHISALVDRRVDVAFIRPAVGDPRLTDVPLTTEARVAVLPAKDPRADATALRVADMDDAVFLGVPDQVPRAYADFLFLTADRDGEQRRRSAYTGRRAEELLAGVAAGLGVTTTITSFPPYYPWPGVRYVPLVDATAANTSLVGRAGDPAPLPAAFLATARALACALP